MLSIGDSKVSKLYLGDTECKKAYLGDTLVLDNSEPPISVSPVLNENSWDVISKVTTSGKAQDYWKVGDTKTIVLNGKIGTLTLNNLSIDVFILGFDHNQSIESPGEHRIHWGLGKINGTRVALIDSNFDNKSTNGTKYFNMNHWGNSVYGGWPGCDSRYDIFGSTNVPPSGYGNAPTSGRVGYDPANYDIVNNPNQNTLMAALPTDLRRSMKTVVKYSCSDENKSVPSIDYILPLARFEVYGKGGYDEANYLLQYDEFKTSSKRKIYKYNGRTTRVMAWQRSAYTNNYFEVFSSNSTDGANYNTSQPYYSEGIFSIFFT